MRIHGQQLRERPSSAWPRRAGFAAALTVVFIAGAATWSQVWDGRNANVSLPYEEAVQILRDESATPNRRRNAMMRIQFWTIEAGDAMRSIEHDDALVADAELMQDRVLNAWRK